MKTPLYLLLLTFAFAGCAKKEMNDTGEMSKENLNESQVTVNSVQPVKSEVLLAMQCYNNAFYHQYGTYGPSYKAYYYADVTHSGRMDFWKQAEAIETLIDAYPSNNYKAMAAKAMDYTKNNMCNAQGLQVRT